MLLIVSSLVTVTASSRQSKAPLLHASNLSLVRRRRTFEQLACFECTDERNSYMQSNDLVCGQYPYAYEKLCKHNENWAKQKFCQRSCYANGAGYDGDVCCAAPPPPTPLPSCKDVTDKQSCKATSGCKWSSTKEKCKVAAPPPPMPLPPPTACTECTDERNNYMQSNDLVCGQYPYAYEKLCKHNENWAKQKFCQRSCYANGAGYDGDVCCAAPPPTACTECTDERNNYMQSNDLVCGQYPYAYEKLCKHNENWAKQKFCQRSCYANGAGYDGDMCCARALAPPPPRALQPPRPLPLPPMPPRQPRSFLSPSPLPPLPPRQPRRFFPAGPSSPPRRPRVSNLL